MTEMPFPPSLWDDLLEFLKPGRYGNVRLNVKDGQIVDADFSYKRRPASDQSGTKAGHCSSNSSSNQLT